MSAPTVMLDVTFVIAAYNAADTLADAIASALAQEGVSLEVIVVDDCSTDGTREMVADYSDSRVRLIAQAINGGPAAARNAGFSAATGRWIAVLDADDTIHPHRLRTMIDRAKAADAQVVVDNIDVVPLDGGAPEPMFPREELQKRPLMTLAEFIRSNVIFGSTFNFGYMKPIFERIFLLEHGLRFDETLRIGEDYALLAAALASGARCAVEPSAGYVYHLRHGSISRILKPHHLHAMLEADETFLQRYRLDADAMAAQKLRTRSIREAASFITLIDEIKKRSVGGILKTAIGHPQALKHLRMPIAVRMRRLAKAVGVH
ncbi:glycosyltransferase family 2 protein [Neorhizobium lilium]|uniref:Glycosyltransferase family 2 protein n=1 Tax=Neorhizobium lilium TaxID=2503024 RepID=A0A444LKB5_9HYPH|nr:glycosyltransferase family 2 protein [Neorhizobium lilium]